MPKSNRHAAQRVSVASLLQLLKSNEPEVVAATSILLGKLRPQDPRVIPALGRALERAATPQKTYLLDALSRFEAKKSFRHIAPYLLVHGSLREQAIRLAQEQGPEVLSEIRRLARRASTDDLISFLRVAGAIPGVEALDFIADQIPNANFEQGKSLLTAIGHRASNMSASERRHLARRLCEFLDSPPKPVQVTGEITALKLLACIRAPNVARRLVVRTSPECPNTVRSNSLEALLSVPLHPKDRNIVISAMKPLLTGTNTAHASLSLRILLRLDPPGVDLDDILKLTNSPNTELARIAYSELRHFDRSAAAEALFDGLLRTNPALAEAAAFSLGEIRMPLEDLVRAHENPRFAARQESLREIIAARQEKLTSARFRLLVRTLLEDGLEESVFTSRLLLLATVDRTALNRMAEARTVLALKSSEPERALKLLEPLVRGRLATPRGRYLLALAHLQLLPESQNGDSPHFERATNLLSPLARLLDWSLSAHLLKEKHISSGALSALAEHFERRPEPEASLGRALRRTSQKPVRA